MARSIELNRTQAEWLVDLLEDCDPAEAGTWRHDLAAEIRTEFGMCPPPELIQEKLRKLWDACQSLPAPDLIGDPAAPVIKKI